MSRFLKNLDNSKLLQIIRQALVMLIPILLVGSFALILETLPIRSYQVFIREYYNGYIINLLEMVYNVTLGTLGIYMTLAIALSIQTSEDAKEVKNFSLLFISIISFMMFSGAFDLDKFNLSNLGENGVLAALICTFSSSYLYILINKNIKHRFRFYSSGADDAYTQMLYSMPALIFVIIINMFVYAAMTKFFAVNSMQDLCFKFLSRIMIATNNSLISTTIMLLLQSVLWFIGIHGINLVTASNSEISVVASGNIQKILQMHGQVDSNTIINVFAVMGGCGATLCLAIAILLFGRKKTSRKLIAISSVPLLFNVNELILFGLPIVLNPIYLIPFVLTPTVSYLNSVLAIKLGLIPEIVSSVHWTTPIFVNAYMVTNSFAGILLQLFNLAIGVAIYAPFVIYSEKRSLALETKKVNQLISHVMELEENGEEINLLGKNGPYGTLARAMADEINYKIEHKDIKIKYQPQFNNKDQCIGVECLLDWEYSNYGKVYTPLIVYIAKEMGCIIEFEKAIFIKTLDNVKDIVDILGKDTKVSINLTGQSIQKEEFEEFLVLVASDYKDYIKNLLIEITEQDSLKIDYELISRLERLKKLGYRFAIDDFSMGSTSLKYLRYNVFDLVKIDGNLSLDVVKNERSREIVSFLANLTKQFNIDILAEYVEDREQKEVLESIGCLEYQGYYYSEAVDLDKLEFVLKKSDKKESMSA